MQEKETMDKNVTDTDMNNEAVTDTNTEETVSEETTETEETVETEEPEKKRGFFGKDKKDKKDEKIEELNDRLMRNLAEFDNFRKRSEREKAQMFEIGARDIIEKILPVIDNFERGLATVSEEEKESGFVQGIDKVYKQLVQVLDTAGVKPIEAVGKEFDPNFHNAVMHAEDENFEANIVAEEFQKGYTYRDTVIRHSMVKVVN